MQAERWLNTTLKSASLHQQPKAGYLLPGNLPNVININSLFVQFGCSSCMRKLDTEPRAVNYQQWRRLEGRDQFQVLPSVERERPH